MHHIRPTSKDQRHCADAAQNAHHHRSAQSLLDPVHFSRADVLSHISCQRHAKTLRREKGKHVDFIRPVKSSHKVRTIAVYQTLQRQCPHRKKHLLQACGQAQTDNLSEQFPVKEKLQRIYMNVSIFAVNQQNADTPGNRLRKNCRDGDAYDTPLKHDHKQQIQQDIQPTGDGQQKQRCFAVPQRLHDGAVQIISQGKNRPGKNNRHI